jgi:uncharacterized protein YegL
MKKKVIYQLILDRSGSMNDCIPQTISGFNEQVQRIRQLEGEYPDQEIRVNLCLFNHNILHQIVNATTDFLEELTRETYIPEGMTALYDAIGLSVRKVQQGLARLTDKGNTRVYVVIITDGYENASQKFTYHQISSQIRDLEATGKWSFSYLGSTPDAVEIAVMMNIKRDKSVRFMKENIDMAFSGVSENFSKFMSDFDEEDPE